jgi:hypothetical protein
MIGSARALALSRVAVAALLLAPLGVCACGGQDLELVNGANWKAHVYERGEPWGEALGDLVFRPEVCKGLDLTPAYNRLDENDLINFLRGLDIKFNVERPREDLAYLVVDDKRTRRPARLRVAILENADEAGRELADAIAQHGNGSWGVHRSNLAVLGPVGDTSHDLAFAAETKLVCWGVFTVVGSRDTVVIPGGYREL